MIARLPLAGLPLRFLVLVGAALAAGLFYLLLSPLIDGAADVALKGSGVALLALAALQLPVRGAGRLALVMALGAAGDVLLELPGLFLAGGASFAAGHLVAILFYAQHRRQTVAVDRIIAALLILYGLAMPPLLTPAGLPVGFTMIYAVLLCGMAASLWISRFPRLAALGGLLFVLSDTVLVLRMGGGHLLGPALDGALVWISYFGGQWLIALGVARGLLARAAHPD
ncbi:lysoplasmalogenase family protein [Sandarakinorhabdus sp.]|uniref:lysoplasmalogenase family protein n=1 Tax=Sandarakinorhabdus sp. TaxID=1916663 RepID=UPI00333E44C5